MNIYKVTRGDPIDYDTFDSFVVVAPDEATARRPHPANSRDLTLTWNDCTELAFAHGTTPGCWCGSDGRPERMDNGWTNDIEALTVTTLGKAGDIKPGVVLASFNAG